MNSIIFVWLTTVLKNTFENTVGKGENAGFQQFLLFPQCSLSYLWRLSPFNHLEHNPSLNDSKLDNLWKRRKKEKMLLTIVTPLPNKPWFSRACSMSFENEQFLFFPQCFLTIWRTICHFHIIPNCHLQNLSIWKSLKFVVWERVKQWYVSFLILYHTFRLLISHRKKPVENIVEKNAGTKALYQHFLFFLHCFLQLQKQISIF